MSKKTINLEKSIMVKIKSGKIAMKPRWFFVLGSISMILGLIAASISAIFLINLMFFLLRQHGPMGEWRLQLMVESFPWWVLLFGLGGIASGICLLKKYDFSYKKNFSIISGIFVLAIIFAAFLINLTGINDLWSRQGPMRKFYQRHQPSNVQNSPAPAYKGKMQNSQEILLFKQKRLAWRQGIKNYEK